MASSFSSIGSTIERSISSGPAPAYGAAIDDDRKRDRRKNAAAHARERDDAHDCDQKIEERHRDRIAQTRTRKPHAANVHVAPLDALPPPARKLLPSRVILAPQP